MCKEFIVIGIPDSNEPVRDAQTARMISENRLFSGGKRHHELLLPYLPDGHTWIDITVPLDAVFEKYAQTVGTIVVFASGDPLFFGFANTIRRKLPDAKISLYPSFNSLQMLAHRLVMPYHDMHIVSLTGRPWHEFDAALIRRIPKIGILTDGTHTPSAIARRMLEYGYDDYVMSVGVRLGNPELESVSTLTLQEAAESDFDMPNCVIAEARSKKQEARGEKQEARSKKQEISNEEKQEARSKRQEARGEKQEVRGERFDEERVHPIPEQLFELLDGREKMITKAPIRQLTLAALELYKRTSFWDIGFCTGSVSIEAKLQYPHLLVTAFEIREEGRQLMETNSHRFHAPGIATVIGDFMLLDVESYPQPDAVFIGGHGGQLPEMIRKAEKCLKAGGVLVYNCVSPEAVSDSRIRTDSRQRFVETAEACGMKVELPLHVAINDYHPIDILKARKI